MDKGQLRIKAIKTRLDIIDAIAIPKKGHIGGALSCIEILVNLFYAKILRFDPKNPQWNDRDRFILSKGHVGIALYVILADLGFFDKKELGQFNMGSILGEHPDRKIPGIEIDSGSLGHGLGIGAGMALVAKRDKKDYQTVVMLGDGECYEGSIWEASMFAAHHQLDNLVAIVDRNKLCIHGCTEDINRLEPFCEKWAAFGWDVKNIDGHSFEDVKNAFSDFRNRKKAKPLVIIANTIKGKGVSFMENQAKWHHGGIAGDNYKKARQELEMQLKEFACDCV